MDQIWQQLMQYAKGMWHRRWWGVIVAWIVCVIGWTVVMTLPNSYQATARVYVDTQSLLRPLLQGLTVGTDVDQQILLMTRQLFSRPTLEKVARMTDMDISAKTPEQNEKLLDSLGANMAISDAGKENLYSISFEHPDPELARKVVQSLLTIFVESSLGRTRKDISSSARFIEEQLNQYEQKLIDAEGALTRFKQEHIGMMPGEGGGYYEKLTLTSASLRQAQLDLREAENRRNQLKAQLADEEPEIEAAAISAQATTSDLALRIQALEKQMDQLRLQYTDRHPDIQATLRLIKTLKAQQTAEASSEAPSSSSRQGAMVQNPVYQQLTLAGGEAEATVSALQARVAEFQQRYRELLDASNRIPEIEQQYTQLTRDYEVYRQNYDTLLKRRESVSMSGEVESKTDTVDFRVIDPPFVPSSPSSPNRPLLLSIVTVGGLLAGLAVAFLLSQLRRTVGDRRSIRELTGLPLLGAVSRVENDETRAHKRRSLLATLAAVGSLFTAYAAIMVLHIMLSRAG